MHLKTKFDKALASIKSLEGQITQKVKEGSKEPEDFLEMSYYSGLHNGFKFVWYILDHPNEITEQKFDEMLRQILHLNPKKVVN